MLKQWMCINILLFLIAYSNTHKCIHRYTYKYILVCLSSNFSAYQPYLVHFNISNTNKKKNPHKYSNTSQHDIWYGGLFKY